MKKIFKYLAAALGIILLVFFSLGLIKPAVYYQNSIIVNVTPEQAFATFKDTAVMKSWITGLKRIEFMEGNMNGAGSKWKLILDQDGKHYELTETMTAYEENRRFAFTLEGDILVTDVDIRFTPSQQGTIITADNKVKGKKLIWRSLFVITESYFKKEGQKMYDNLKLLIDKNQVTA